MGVPPPPCLGGRAHCRGIFVVIHAVLMLAYGYGWAALLMLVAAAVLFSFGYLELTVARSTPPRT